MNIIFFSIIVVSLILMSIVSFSVYKITSKMRLLTYKNSFMPRHLMIRQVVMLYMVTIIAISIGFTISFFTL